MARQRGEIRLDGKIGDLLFYKSKRYGYMVRGIGRVSTEKRQTDPSFARVRDNNSEFGYSARMSKLIRQGVKRCCSFAEEGTTHHRLNGTIRNVVMADTKADLGKRVLTVENTGLLKGFNWKEDIAVGSVLLADYSVALVGTDGSATLSINAFVPSRDVKPGDGATHVEITLVLVGADHDSDSRTYACDKSEVIALSGKSSLSINLSCALNEFSGRVLVAGIGVQGYQQVGGKMVPLMERAVFEIGAGGVGV